MGERTNRERIDLLNREKHLSFEDWQALLSTWTDGDRVYAGELGGELARRRFGRKIFMRGIVEFSNCCRNDCLYCGLRRSNRNLERYRLREEEIFTCCAAGYANGFRTFVLQGGEDPLFSTERMVKVVAELRRRYPDCAVTLSIGELERADYQRLYDAGADRYLLRHETADEAHYGRLHPADLSWSHRMNCLKTLKEIGYQTGCGMMVGSPFQTPETLAKDMLFMEEFRPQMIGMGPFLPNKDTPFANQQPGDLHLTLLLLSLCRIMLPDVLLPATTALATLHPQGRQMGVLAGANVVMPNLSPENVRGKYALYDRIFVDGGAEKAVALLREQMGSIDYEITVSRGDYAEETSHD